MSFDPSLPTEGINVTPTHPLREALVLIAGVVAIGFAVTASIGVLTDLVAPRISPEIEMRLFSDWFDEDRESDESSERIAAVGALLNRVAAHWPDNAYEFRIRIWSETEPNALALPGGTIVVTTGLLEAVTSENELAFVLGHELGHFHNRDHLRGLGRGIGAALVLFAVGIGGGGSAAELASVASQLTQRGFDRGQESQADEFGMRLVVAEYGHTAGATDLFDHLRGPGDGSTLASYLSTHPLHVDRIDRLRSAARTAGWPLRGKRHALDASLRDAPEPTPAPAQTQTQSQTQSPAQTQTPPDE